MLTVLQGHFTSMSSKVSKRRREREWSQCLPMTEPGVHVFPQPLASVGWAESQRHAFLLSGRPNSRQPLSNQVSAFSS